MATWKKVITEQDNSSYKNNNITLAQLDAGLDGESNYGPDKILKVNGAGNAIVWSDDTGGISLTDLSVGSEGTASGDGAIAYNSGTGVFTYTPPANLPNQDVDSTASPSWVDGTFTGGDLYIKGSDNGSAKLHIWADRGDDAADKWSIENTTAATLKFIQDGTEELTITQAGFVTIAGNLQVTGNEIKASGGATCITLNSDASLSTASSITASGDISAGTGSLGGASCVLTGGTFTIKTMANATKFSVDNNGNTTIEGNLTVNGTTTTVSTTNLEVEDKNILLGNPDSAFADDAAAVSANTGAGLSVVTDSATAGNYANLTWNTNKNLTGWCLEDTANAGVFEASVMEYSSDSTAPDGNAAGVGSFHYDTGDDTLYIRTA